MSRWPMIPLGEIITQDTKATSVHADREYPNFGIYSFGRGLFAKPPISGATTSASTLYQVRAGQFIYSRLFAFEGAYGLVGEEFDGCFISNEYPHFDCDSKRIRSDYLVAYFKWRKAWEQAATLSTGMGDRRRRIQPEQLLKLPIPIPPLTEQRRLVEHFDTLSIKIDEAKRLREDANGSSDRLLIAMAHRDDLPLEQKTAEGWRNVTLDQILSLSLDTVQVSSTACYPNLGIYSFGRGLFEKPPIDGMATSAKTLTRVHSGQFIYSRLFAFEGAYGVVNEHFDGSYVSSEYPTFNSDPAQVIHQFLGVYFQSPRIWREVAHGSKGLGDRRQRVQPEKILGHTLLLPPLSWQQRIAEVQSIHVRGQSERTEVAKELAALMPAVLDQAFNSQERGEDA